MLHSRLGPDFPEVLETCVNQGAKSVVVIPYFLQFGLHILLDIPEMLQEQALRYPHVKMTFGRGFGFDDLLVTSPINRSGRPASLVT